MNKVIIMPSFAQNAIAPNNAYLKFLKGLYYRFWIEFGSSTSKYVHAQTFDNLMYQWRKFCYSQTLF